MACRIIRSISLDLQQSKHSKPNFHRRERERERDLGDLENDLIASKELAQQARSEFEGINQEEILGQDRSRLRGETKSVHRTSRLLLRRGRRRPRDAVPIPSVSPRGSLEAGRSSAHRHRRRHSKPAFLVSPLSL
ncbi:hypothetical protein BHE74_00036620 [Ensete ventricosum]|nr:hypothetical protein GW17_00043599 [Ensete ventricosum]RWW56666.1 hypothetical protein BHE74_00036620 [Ensete ventricosum]RZS27054.1 hypothetical protein BHM03_00060490 [Ensete ventricosum]